MNSCMNSGVPRFQMFELLNLSGWFIQMVAAYYYQPLVHLLPSYGSWHGLTRSVALWPRHETSKWRRFPARRLQGPTGPLRRRLYPANGRPLTGRRGVSLVRWRIRRNGGISGNLNDCQEGPNQQHRMTGKKRAAGPDKGCTARNVAQA